MLPENLSIYRASGIILPNFKVPLLHADNQANGFFPLIGASGARLITDFGPGGK